MGDRDDANLRQFKSRAQQPKLLASGPANAPSQVGPGSSVNLFVVFDSDFGSTSDQIERNRFLYQGTSPSVSPYEGMCSRRTHQESFSSVYR